MRRVVQTVFRGVLAAFVAFAVFGSGVLPQAGPATAAAQTSGDNSIEDNSLNALEREARKAHNEYRQVLGYANAAASERLARQAAGAARGRVARARRQGGEPGRQGGDPEGPGRLSGGIVPDPEREYKNK